MGLALVRIASKQPLNLTDLRQQPYYFDFLKITAPDIALSQ